MPRWEPEHTVTQSVLERLIDREPKEQQEMAPTRAQSVRQLKSSLRRDLDWLLNTRRTPEAVGSEYQEVEHSVFNYGIPDLTSLSWQSERNPSSQVYAASVPSPNMRGGIFGAAVRDPLTGLPFPNNTVPAIRYSAESSQTS